jgi:peptidoglycan hydrolase-like protein with peptidoglycan-binding domain
MITVNFPAYGLLLLGGMFRENMLMRLAPGLLLLALLSGCSIHEEPDAGPEPQLAPAAVSGETPAASTAADTVTPAQPEAAQPIVAETKPSGKEGVRAKQARLRKAGFNPGPVDGIFGDKTKAALARLESACATLGDLLGSAAAHAVQKTAGALGPLEPGRSVGSAESIRVLQVRLKEAGFDPGPIDGIAGTKTRAALARLESGCARDSQ